MPQGSESDKIPPIKIKLELKTLRIFIFLLPILSNHTLTPSIYVGVWKINFWSKYAKQWSTLETDISDTIQLEFITGPISLHILNVLLFFTRR